MRSSFLLPALLALASQIVSLNAQANMSSPLRNPDELAEGQPIRPVRVAGARILTADYDLVIADFGHEYPELREMSHDQINEWLLAKAGYVRESQANQEVANSKITLVTDAEGQPIRADAFVPKTYDRAMVFADARKAPLMDVKGNGTQNPRPNTFVNGLGSYSDGLATVAECIREFLFEKMTRKIFQHSGLPRETVGTYAVIDWGFDVKHADGTQSPAGAVLRQAHSRTRPGAPLGEKPYLHDTEAREVESVLRHYGVASTGLDKVNLQGIRELVDFGAFLVHERFEKPALQNWSEQLMISVGSPYWAQPEDGLKLPFETWGYSRSGQRNSKYDNVYIDASELSLKLRAGQANTDDVEQFIRRRLDAGNFDPKKAGWFSAFQTNILISSLDPTKSGPRVVSIEQLLTGDVTAPDTAELKNLALSRLLQTQGPEKLKWAHVCMALPHPPRSPEFFRALDEIAVSLLNREYMDKARSIFSDQGMMYSPRYSIKLLEDAVYRVTLGRMRADPNYDFQQADNSLGEFLRQDRAQILALRLLAKTSAKFNEPQIQSLLRAASSRASTVGFAKPFNTLEARKQLARALGFRGDIRQPKSIDRIKERIDSRIKPRIAH
jgi:hypothetical protein